MRTGLIAGRVDDAVTQEFHERGIKKYSAEIKAIAMHKDKLRNKCQHYPIQIFFYM